MFLNGGQTADPLVVSEGFVTGGDKAGDARFAHFLQHMQSNTTVEKDEGPVQRKWRCNTLL